MEAHVEKLWNEFRTYVFPWLVSAAFIILLVWLNQKDAARWEQAIAQLSVMIQKQAEAIESVHQIMGTQGYTLPPSHGTR